METRFFENPSQFRVWLKASHSTSTEIGVVLHKKNAKRDETRATGRAPFPGVDSTETGLRKYLVLLVAGLLLATACGVTPAAVKVSNTQVPKLSGQASASFGMVEIDQSAHRLYATDRTDSGIDVFDTTSAPARYLTTVALPATPNGLAIAPDLSRVFAGMSDGSVAIIDTGASSPTVDTAVKLVPTTGRSVDLIDYSPALHEVFASNGIEGTIAAVDAATGQVKAHFQVGYALEQPRFNSGDGMLYVTSSDADSIFRIDPTTGAIKGRIRLGGCLPHGMAIDPKSNQAVIACASDVRRWNLRTITDATIFSSAGGGGDIVTYDAATSRFLVGMPQKIATSGVAVFGGSPIAYITTVRTGGGGSSAAYDDTNNAVYTPEIRPGKAGLESFAVPSTELDFAISLQSMSLVGVLVVVVVLVMFFIGKGGDPINRPVPVTRRRRA